ncbi:tRNA (uracil-5-)-methyltransferase homolog A-like [Centruroides sculpturatus]|uniref:tRNA (uracil-5-)-methyltransferase homolog A-like n=1 Tax=Centruroides sculpturatus TaxID=218467 RepID=UPI000C6EA698|nr:tRNA (uracil-5-)-methyltransferase homolog A-like [Centruroides sculpturatus]
MDTVDSGNQQVSEMRDEHPLNENIEDVKEEEEKEAEKIIDPYFYTKRDEFTSEIFKIEIGNLPPFIRYGPLKKLLGTKLKLNPHKIKTIGNSPLYSFVTFKCEEDREKALNVLQGYEWKGRKLQVKKANPMADPLVKKRKQGNAEDSPAVKKARMEGSDIPISIQIKNAVHPLWNLPYEEQLKSKMNQISQFLIKLCVRIEKTNTYLRHWSQKQKKLYEGMCCELLPIKPSPVTSAYRNKCEFTVGKHLDTGEKTVGFRLNCYKSGSMSVAEPDECINIPESMLKAVKSFQDYIRSSDKDVFNPETHEGYWRQLTVRTGKTDVLLVVVMHPQKLEEEELQKEKEALVEYFQNGLGKMCGVTSLYFQSFVKRESNKDLIMTHLWGKKYIEENVLGLKFQINPEAFFQINTSGAEVLYSTIAELAEIDNETTILDICCGTGTIGLCLAKIAPKVIGIEMCSQAIENAKSNAQINNINNVEFVCGKAEDFIQTVLQKADTENIVAIVDPPRAGLNSKVLKFIRANEKLKKLIYIACNPDGAIQNFVDLCRPVSNNYRGESFVPTRAVVVDLFPHTNHCELVIVFERYSKTKENNA